MTPSKIVKVVTSGRADPIRVDNYGPSDPVILVDSGRRADPVKIVTHGRSTPVRVIEDRRTPVATGWYLTDGITLDDVCMLISLLELRPSQLHILILLILEIMMQ